MVPYIERRKKKKKKKKAVKEKGKKCEFGGLKVSLLFQYNPSTPPNLDGLNFVFRRISLPEKIRIDIHAIKCIPLCYLSL